MCAFKQSRQRYYRRNQSGTGVVLYGQLLTAGIMCAFKQSRQRYYRRNQSGISGLCRMRTSEAKCMTGFVS